MRMNDGQRTCDACDTFIGPPGYITIDEEKTVLGVHYDAVYFCVDCVIKRFRLEIFRARLRDQRAAKARNLRGGMSTDTMTAETTDDERKPLGRVSGAASCSLRGVGHSEPEHWRFWHTDSLANFRIGPDV